MDVLSSSSFFPPLRKQTHHTESSIGHQPTTADAVAPLQPSNGYPPILGLEATLYLFITSLFSYSTSHTSHHYYSFSLRPPALSPPSSLPTTATSCHPAAWWVFPPPLFLGCQAGCRLLRLPVLFGGGRASRGERREERKVRGVNKGGVGWTVHNNPHNI